MDPEHWFSRQGFWVRLSHSAVFVWAWSADLDPDPEKHQKWRRDKEKYWENEAVL
jgi:hypothetical protein